MAHDEEELVWEEYRQEKYSQDAIREGADADVVVQWRLRRTGDEGTT